MAGSTLNINSSVAGSRALVEFGAYESLVTLSQNAIQHGGKYITTGQTVNPINSSRGSIRPWWDVTTFDNNSTAVPMYGLFCERVDFNWGDPLYHKTDDAVPGTRRVRAQRTGGYSYNLSFPLIINNSLSNNVYDALYNFLSYSYYKARIRTSLQNNYLNNVLENFSISVDGYGGANPVTCTLKTKGITRNRSITNEKINPRNIVDASPFLRDSRGSSIVKGVDSDDYGGRISNIKDCSITFDGKQYSQIVKMHLEISQNIMLKSNGLDNDVVILQGKAAPIQTATHLFINKRVVSGSFTFLASSANAVNPFIDLDLDTAYVDKSTNVALNNVGQWATFLQMSYGPMTFTMPTIYWQPHVQELSTGSPLVTVDFIALSNHEGYTEFYNDKFRGNDAET